MTKRTKWALVLCVVLWVIFAGVVLWQFDIQNPYEKVNEFVVNDLHGCDGRVVIMFGKAENAPPDIVFVYHNSKLLCYFYHIGEDYFVVRKGEVKKTNAETIGAFLNFFLKPCQEMKQQS